MTPRLYCVVDLEATCDDQGSIARDASEIIEIGAVLVDGASLRAIGELDVFVRPVVHPRLTPFCIQLTTIAQDDVEHAIGFAEASARLAAFGAGALFCSWGNYDRNQLAQDARRHGVAAPLGPEHLNVKEAFATASGTRKMGTYAALARCGLTPTGVHHRGIDDARNIARVLPYAIGRWALPPASGGAGT